MVLSQAVTVSSMSSVACCVVISLSCVGASADVLVY